MWKKTADFWVEFDDAVGGDKGELQSDIEKRSGCEKKGEKEGDSEGIFGMRAATKKTSADVVEKSDEGAGDRWSRSEKNDVDREQSEKDEVTEPFFGEEADDFGKDKGDDTEVESRNREDVLQTEARKFVFQKCVG